ncbi:MAG: aspartyl/glutamyl-tRNA amidotransferase subunit C [Spirochaetaceae bacterium]|jgi:aspartyl-tRNA(Asn)/glutamyl-tRNA(Gln) amidotransferase subunit C|nr:aspartyl/glutamyl-tRNA amidotransferase subunit C [Spirochaetaceae bacterium]
MNIEDLQETARLAHLKLDEGEIAGAFPAFEQMLTFFAAMQAADEDEGAFSAPISRVSEPQWTADSRHFRPDQGQSGHNRHHNQHNFLSPSTGLNENLLNNAGERDGRFIVVPNVL